MPKDEPTKLQVSGRRLGKVWALAQDTKEALAAGKRVMMWMNGELVDVVGVVDDPHARHCWRRREP